jgi:hypothetical protein
MSASASMICVKRSRVIESGARACVRGSMERVYTTGEEAAYEAASLASPVHLTIRRFPITSTDTTSVVRGPLGATF